MKRMPFLSIRKGIHDGKIVSYGLRSVALPGAIFPDGKTDAEALQVAIKLAKEQCQTGIIFIERYGEGATIFDKQARK